MYSKVKRFVRLAFLLSVAIVSAFAVFGFTYRAARDQGEADARAKVELEVSSMRAAAEAAKIRSAELSKLTELTLSAMEVVGAKMGDHKRLALAAQVARVAHSSFVDHRHREAWVALLAIESRFNEDARSPMGAVGVGQVTPPTAKDFWKMCGLPEEVSAEDLTEPLVNLPLSACIFRETLAQVDGSVPLALAAYNAGRYSKTLQDLKKLRNINSETSSYISKHAVLVDMLMKE